MKFKYRYLAVVLMVVSCFGIIGCSNGSVKKTGTMEFEDFLVERCVREELGIDWDEEITYEEVAEIEELVISSAYNPTILDDRQLPVYTGYVDLTDLQYFTNLEELTLNMYIHCDTIANLEAITNCKKLKKLSVPCNLGIKNTRSIGNLGYKYWADILAELPKLEYLDLGMYVDEHMKEAMLAETRNKDIEFYQADDDYMNKECIYAAGFGTRLVYNVSDAAEYNDSWDYDFEGYETMYKDFDSISYGDGYEGVFPVLEGNEEEIIEKLSMLSDNTEDIIIKYQGEYFDFSVLERFDNLVTLSINGVSGYKAITPTDGSVNYVGVEPRNLDTLAEFEYLQVLNLCGFQGDLSDIAKCKELREVSLDNCSPSSADFISKLKDVKELTLGLYTYGKNDEDNQIYWGNLGKEVCSLSDLKLYRDNNVIVGNYDCYENIEDMSSLETLFIDGASGELESVLKSQTIKYLCLQGKEVVWESSKKASFEEMKNLQVCYLDCFATNFDYESLLDLNEIQTVFLPKDLAKEVKDTLTVDLAEKVVAHKNISAFISGVEKEWAGSFYKNTDIDYIEKLYEEDVVSGLVHFWLKKQWEQGIEDNDFEDFIDYVDSEY